MSILKIKSHDTTVILKYLLLILLGFIMVYPLLWMAGASFKTNQEIFSGPGIFPKNPVFDAYRLGWKGSGQYTFTRFYINTFKLVIPTVFFTLVSSVLVGYGFARFNFPLKKILFMLMLSTLMLPNSVTIIPRFIFFKTLGWLDTYWPFITPAMLGAFPFYNFMMVQFFRGIPQELDESARLDGCNSFNILKYILLPLCKPAIFSVMIFQFISTWNGFFNVLIYINSVSKYPLALGLRMTIDISSQANWNQIMAMSVVSILPPVLLFFGAQKYFIEGIATSGIKG